MESLKKKVDKSEDETLKLVVEPPGSILILTNFLDNTISTIKGVQSRMIKK